MHTHQKITLDINQNSSFVYINAKQGDKSTRYVDAIITCDGVQYKPPVGAIAYFRCEKSDGTGCSYPATINTDGSVTAELTNKALSAPGDVVADISIEGMQGEVLSTASFTIRVEEIPLGDNIESSNEYVRLIALTNRANEIVSELENAAFRTFQGYIQATTDGENWVDLVEINTLVGSQGPAGKSAYAYAQDGGYTGTEEEFAYRLAQGSAFYVTIRMNSDGTAYEADKSLTELDAAHQAGQLLYCIFDDNPDDIHLPLLSKVDGARYTFGGATLTDIITVKISYYEVKVEIRDIQSLDDVKAFYVNVRIDSETGDYVADKTVEEIGEAYRGGRPVFCNYSGSKTSACLVCIGERVANRVYEFSGASFTHTINVVCSVSAISVSIKELSTFYVTVSPTDSTATDWKADKTVDEIGEAYQAGRPIFCKFYGETGYRMTLLLTTWTNPPTYKYSFSGVNSERAVNVNIGQNGVGVVINDLVTPDDIAAFYVTVEFDSETRKYIADKTTEEIGAAHLAGKPVYCHLIPNTGSSVYLTLHSDPVSDTVYTFSGASSSSTTMVSIDPTSINVYTTEIPTAFYVNVQYESDTGTYVADSTPGEISGAYHSGKPVYCHLVTQDFSYLLPLKDEVMAGRVYGFGGADSTRGISVYIQEDSVSVGINETPTALPNPHKLTLTGAVSAEYDGSEAVSVEIPLGGTGGEQMKDPGLIGDCELIAFGKLIEVGGIDVNKDMNGNDFELTKAVLIICGPREVDSTCRFLYNKKYNEGVEVGGRTSDSYTVFECRKNDRMKITTYSGFCVKEVVEPTPSITVDDAGNFSISNIISENIKSVSAISWNGNGNYAANTTYALYGVRA